MAASHPNHDPALSSSGPNASASAGGGSLSGSGGIPAEMANLQIGNLDPGQLMSLLKHIPGLSSKISDQGNLKEDAAQTLSNLANFSGLSNNLQQHTLPPMPYQMDPGPSSHPRGPPNLGHLANAAGGQLMGSPPLSAVRPQETEEGASDDDMGDTSGGGGNSGSAAAVRGGSAGGTTTGGKRGGRSATMGSDEWSRQRKDNHKEVERRRRGNINEGINELGRIVPNGSGEKAKGAILSRAVQYIHHLKENEARNIEKWTLEKLLMDQAMGDLQSQLDEVRRLWEEERERRKELEKKLGLQPGERISGVKSKSPVGEAGKRGVDAQEEEEGESDSRNGKRQRVD